MAQPIASHLGRHVALEQRAVSSWSTSAAGAEDTSRRAYGVGGLRLGQLLGYSMAGESAAPLQYR